MNIRPSLIISSLDLERIEHLLDSLPAQGNPLRNPLLEELGRADVRAPQDMPPDVVTMNSSVRFVLEPSDTPLSATLVYPKDANGAPDRLSVLAPIGAALLGMPAGGRIEWIGPKGDTLAVRVLEIIYQPERAGEFHR